MSTTAQKLMDALNLWIELSEVDPNKKSFRVSMGGGMCEWTVKRMHDLIKEALELDHSNTTGVLMLDALSDAYFGNRSFSVNELLSDPARTAAYVQKAGQLRDMVKSPEFMEQNNRFVGNLRSALKMYAMDSDEALKLTENLHEVGFLRRDAFRSIQNLRVDQFLAGQPEPEGTLPVYQAWVHQFWNINTLVEKACQQPSGVTLNLVRDPDDLQSYFVFAIRNGGNLFLLSDVPVQAHPLQRYMSRRPERAFSERASRNWYPYELLNLKFDEDSRQFFADETRRRALVPQQQVVDRIKPISELAPEEILWTVMMFDLIVEKFWTKGHQEANLSYTGAMIQEETPLIEAATKANLPVVAYQTLALPRLTHADLTADKVVDAVGHDGNRPYAWLEERFADQVDEELFNLLDNGTNTLYLPPAKNVSGRARDHKNHELATVSASHVSVLAKDDEHLPFWNKEGRYGLHAMNTTMFGTRQELEHNRIFLARYNMAKGVSRLAAMEFAERKEAVLNWWKDRVTKNGDYLLSLAAAGLVRRVYEPTDPGCRASPVDGFCTADLTFNFVKAYGPDDEYPTCLYTLGLHKGYNRSRDKFGCFVTEAASSYRVLFQPQNAKQLAELAGCALSELPDVLQHWSPDRDHRGNHILDRIDPMAWAVTDPWSSLDFRVLMFLSKRGYAQIQKQYPESVAAGKEHQAAREALKGKAVYSYKVL